MFYLLVNFFYKLQNFSQLKRATWN